VFVAQRFLCKKRVQHVTKFYHTSLAFFSMTVYDEGETQIVGSRDKVKHIAKND